PTMTTKIGDVLADYPGKAAGIKAGDTILEINGQAVDYWEDVTSIIRMNKRPQVDVLIKRDDQLIDLKVSLKTQELKTIFGSKKRVSLIGIMPSEEVVFVRYGVWKSIYMGGKRLFTLTYITCRALWASLTGAISFKESVTGPVGIFYITGQAARLGFVYLLHLMGILSASLAIFNLLPIPVLDGGHILFLVIEKIRRKPVSHKAQENITQAGLMLLVCLMLFVFYNDFMRYGIFDKITSLWRK
ncbi:MAG: RIP metalloprotease RseP, partial [Candidatus Omnitrophica bacterium]|nr:RIP metalloprotease RseP [Candidatus Omnitrophota bacterium]